ncbi:response regulator of zinc sigma-54-dependent two-component system [Desulfocucumis palustris]|uniref:Response regulator of zinc sigma-54-dependent two-component system n=1 Tax=Desulfocucumis palustris TaxID=1898651 RepID=A0A2L2X8Q5_9FIRM|nr:sigma 54-interacting transcriptional regulator [Desulfocucumis palustris]GBF32565.1 response regulator of zinc sigma-54-dependent two-component system [Desulfocucumis palustris]
MPQIKVGFICRAARLKSLAGRFSEFDFVSLAGAVDPAGGAGLRPAALEPGINVLDSVEELIKLPGLQFVVEDRENAGVVEESNCYTPFGVIVAGARALEKLFRLIKNHGELMQLIRDKELMGIILDNVQEGIQYVDRDGELRYVNPAYTRITGIDPRERIGTNVYNMSRDGALVLALKTKKPVFGLRNTAVYSKTEVISNASPIFDGDELLGAVVAFRDITDMLRLNSELKHSNEVIADLSSRLEHFQSSKYSFDDIMGISEQIRRLKEQGRKMALSDSTVLIQGESGTGKELFAHAIHRASRRSGRPLVEVNCAAIPENLLESELFGHERGAFTGADRQRRGRFELAGGGTIFLDEIGELKQEMQAKLLRVLQSREFERVGGSATIRADVRVVAATNRNLKEMLVKGEFREDLYYRLHVLHLVVPPLRERIEDIPVLARHLLQKVALKLGMPPKSISPEVLKFLQEHSWPGNVRELENMLERLLYYVEGDNITADSLAMHFDPFTKKSAAKERGPLLTLEKAEEQALLRALDFYGRSVEGKRKASKFMGISLATFYNKLKKYNIN